MRMLKKGGGLKSSTLKSLIQSGYDRSQVEGWTKVMDTPEVSAFKHKTTPQVVIVLRGTTGTANDWSNNAVYGIGGEVAYKRTPRYKRAVARVAEIERRLQDKEELKKMRTPEISSVIKENTARYTLFRWTITDDKWGLKLTSDEIDNTPLDEVKLHIQSLINKKK